MVVSTLSVCAPASLSRGALYGKRCAARRRRERVTGVTAAVAAEVRLRRGGARARARRTERTTKDGGRTRVRVRFYLIFYVVRRGVEQHGRAVSRRRVSFPVFRRGRPRAQVFVLPRLWLRRVGTPPRRVRARGRRLETTARGGVGSEKSRQKKKKKLDARSRRTTATTTGSAANAFDVIVSRSRGPPERETAAADGRRRHVFAPDPAWRGTTLGRHETVLDRVVTRARRVCERATTVNYSDGAVA